MISNGKIALQSFSDSNFLVSPSDPLFIVFVLFAAGMLAIRYRCERMQRVDAN